MFADGSDCLCRSDSKRENYDKRWTNLLLNWINKCVKPKTLTIELNPLSLVEVLNKYSQDLYVSENEGEILNSDIEAFIRNKYPILRLRFLDIKEVQKKNFLMTSVILYHCCVSSIKGIVDGDICKNLNKSEQEMILKFCEKLCEMEVTSNNIDLAIKDACDSVKPDPKTYKKTPPDQKPSNLKSSPSENCSPQLKPEMPLSSLKSKLSYITPVEGSQQNYDAIKSISDELYTASDMPMSSFNSMAAAVAENNNRQGQSIEYDTYDTETLLGIPSLTSLIAGDKSETGSLKRKITATFKSVEYETVVPYSATDRDKGFSKSPTERIRQKTNTTIKSVEYETYGPASSYNPNTLEKSPTGNKKSKLNAQSTKNRYESFESCSPVDRSFNEMKGLSKSPTGSLKLRMNSNPKPKDTYDNFESSSAERPSDASSKALYKSRSGSRELNLDDKSTVNYKAYASSPDRTRIGTAKAVIKTPTESRKMKTAKTKAANYLPKTAPVISIMTAGKPPTDQKLNSIEFKSSATVLPSVVTTDASYAEMDYVVNYGPQADMQENSPFMAKTQGSERRCLPNCACSRCSPNGPCCADPGNSMYNCDVNEGTERQPFSDINKEKPKQEEKKERKPFPYKRLFWNKKFLLSTTSLVSLVLTISLLALLLTPRSRPKTRLPYELKTEVKPLSASQEASFQRIFQLNTYMCNQGFCQKIYQPTKEYIYSSLSRCILLCTGPQLWPLPTSYTYYSKNLVVLATNKLEYKFQSVPSEAVHMYLAEAFKLFLGDLAKLERYTLDARRTNISKDVMIKKMYIQMDVENDPDPRLKIDTDESYTIKVETITNQVVIKLLSVSFCGIRHALETLSQLILLDQTTGHLITLSDMVVKDAPSYKYRGLMIDTGRNYIPVPDIMKTIDAMATVKLNTFHWRISDVTSFPLHLPAVPQLFEYGSYGRDLVYTKQDVKAVVKRAGIRGIRILLEVAAPGPVGRAWSWVPEATCPNKNKNLTCDNVLCLRLGIHDSVFDILQIIYSETLEMTKVNDVFHLSDSMFSLNNCFNLIESREGFLEKALERLKLANKGFLPKLPIIWYTAHLMKDLEARTWDRFGVQLTEWLSNPSQQYLDRFRAIHSSRWDLSCEVQKQRCKKYRTWQEMYTWKSWQNLEVFTIEGGEAILWTDLVDTGNLDYHLWPRAAAVAERLWSDIILNSTVTSHVYVRLDSQRWRMVLKSVQVQPIWPLYCSFSPGVCLEKIKNK